MGLGNNLRLFFIGEKVMDSAERKLLRKADTFILSYLCLSQFTNFLDRSNLANAYVSGMKEEIGFVGTDYNKTVTIFTCGYM
jgi:ACS family pantothenate transporter-like MFS transporter